MRTYLGLAAGALISIAALTACSKPKDATADASATPSNAASAPIDTTPSATDPGGAVSPPPSNGNEAINPDANKGDGSQSLGSNSFTEGQARGHIESAGYTDVTGLTKSPEGLWSGKAKKGGKPVSVSVDFKGAVTAN